MPSCFHHSEYAGFVLPKLSFYKSNFENFVCINTGLNADLRLPAQVWGRPTNLCFRWAVKRFQERLLWGGGVEQRGTLGGRGGGKAGPPAVLPAGVLPVGGAVGSGGRGPLQSAFPAGSHSSLTFSKNQLAWKLLICTDTSSFYES